MVLMALVAAMMLVAAGCVTTKKFEGAVSDVTNRVDDVQSRVEEHGEQIERLDARDEEIASEVQQVETEVADVRQTSQTAVQKAEEAQKLARGKVVYQVTLTNRDVRFQPDRTELGEAGTQVLDQLVQRLKSFDQRAFIEIQGHTDATGSEAYNKRLGRQRAEAVEEYLHEQGIPLHLMEVVSYGESRPIADNATREGRSANRRVEILVLQ
jgi:outer membrane protein OmpA-like peptidoglycan-associated protein